MMSSKIKGMIHDVSYREAIRSVDKLISDSKFRDVITKKWGKEFYDQLPKWVRDIANAQNVDDAYAQGAARAFAHIRQNIVSSLIWMKPSTFGKHGLTAFAMSAERTGLTELIKGKRELASKARIANTISNFKDMMKLNEVKGPPEPTMEAIRDIINPGKRGDEIRQFVLDSSAFMRSRYKGYRDSVHGAYQRATRSNLWQDYMNWRAMSMDVGRFPVATSDAASAMPMWWAEYKRARLSGETHDDSVYMADKQVTRAHGSTAIMDQPGVMRIPGETARWFTPLYNFWNHMFNNWLQIAWDADAVVREREEPGGNVQSIANRMFWLGVMPIAVEAYMDHTKQEGGPMKHLFTAAFRFFGGMFIGIREITNAISLGIEPSVGFIASAGHMLASLSKDIFQTGIRKSISKDFMQHLFGTIGMATGFGGDQLGRTLGFGTGYVQGTEKPKDVFEFGHGVRYGHAKERKKH
jgi:hypothetical protein